MDFTTQGGLLLGLMGVLMGFGFFCIFFANKVRSYMLSILRILYVNNKIIDTITEKTWFIFVVIFEQILFIVYASIGAFIFILVCSVFFLHYSFNAYNRAWSEVDFVIDGVHCFCISVSYIQYAINDVGPKAIWYHSWRIYFCHIKLV